MPSLILFKLKITELQAYLAVAMATMLTTFDQCLLPWLFSFHSKNI